jgi:hypothetical protein
MSWPSPSPSPRCPTNPSQICLPSPRPRPRPNSRSSSRQVEMDDDEEGFDDDDDDDDDDDGGVDFERKARQTVARLARQAKESDMEMQTQQDQGFAMPSIEELAAEGEMPADITMLTARVKGTVRLK